MRFSDWYRRIKERMFEKLLVPAWPVFKLPKNERENLYKQLEKRGYKKCHNKWAWEIRNEKKKH